MISIHQLFEQARWKREVAGRDILTPTDFKTKNTVLVPRKSKNSDQFNLKPHTIENKKLSNENVERLRNAGLIKSKEEQTAGIAAGNAALIKKHNLKVGTGIMSHLIGPHYNPIFNKINMPNPKVMEMVHSTISKLTGKDVNPMMKTLKDPLVYASALRHEIDENLTKKKYGHGVTIPKEVIHNHFSGGLLNFNSHQRIKPINGDHYDIDVLKKERKYNDYNANAYGGGSKKIKDHRVDEDEYIGTNKEFDSYHKSLRNTNKQYAKEDDDNRNKTFFGRIANKIGISPSHRRRLVNSIEKNNTEDDDN